MAGHRPDPDGITGILDAGKTASRQVDDRFRAGETLLHCRKKGHAAGQKLASIGHLRRRIVGAGSGFHIGCLVHVFLLYSAASAWASLIARHTFSGDAGIDMSVTPSGDSASMTALISAGGDAMAPASPQPLTPRSLCVQAVTV